MRKILSLFGVLMLCGLLALAQQTKVVTGKVTDEAGNPVPYATVTESGTTNATTADVGGNYSLRIQNNGRLLITSTGFQEFAVTPTGATQDVRLVRGAAQLSEVVVTALGIRRQRNQVAYAAQQVSGEEVAKTRSNNFVSNLSGKISGLEIRQPNTMGASTNVVVRGFKSLTGSNQALFVIDGVPIDNGNNNTLDQSRGRGGYDYGNAAADINPDDIENITVLKGAASSALYGSRGSNGVILVTTKKGKKGLGITVNTGMTRSSIVRSTFPNYQKKYGAGYGSYFDQDDVNGDGVPDNIAPTYDDASWGMKFDPNQLVYQWESFDPTSPNFGKPLPWVGAANDPSAFFEKPLSFNNSIFLETGNDKSTVAFGYTRNNEKGILPNSKIDKDLINFSTTYNLTDKATVGMSANYSRIEGKGRFGTGYDGANALNLMTNFREWWEVNVDLKAQKAAFERSGGKNVTWNMHYGPSGDLYPEFWDNPYFTRYKSFETDDRNRYFGNVFVTYKPISWLNLLARVSLDSYSELEEERKALTSVGVPFYRRFSQDYHEINYDLLANGDWTLSHDINVKALLGSNTRVQTRGNIDATTNGGLVAPDLFTLANSIAPVQPVQFLGTKRVEGVFGGATFTYQNTYTLDATIRRDRSSTLPKAHNVYYYPSVSAGMVFSQLIKQPWLSYGKFRTNYAEVGGDAPLYTVDTFYTNDIDPNNLQEVNNFNGNALFSVSDYRNNSELKPERTKSFEVGLEMAFLRSRVGFDVAYYNAKTVDQIVPLTVSTATGYRYKYVNSGTIENKGVEVSLYGTPLKTKDFSWDINVNWTKNNSKVTKLYNDVDNIVLGEFQGSITVNATLNQPYGSIHGTDYVYTDGQKTVDASGNYLISGSNNIPIGNINPDWTGGVNNRFTYKGFSLSALIDIRKGGNVFNTDLYYALAGGLYEETAEGNIREPLANGGGIIREGVFANGKPNDVKVSLSDDDQGVGGSYGLYDSYVSAPDKRFVYDASYVKLREVSLGYSLPKKWLGGGKVIKGIDIALLGRNLAILHKKLPYADPEDSFGAGNLQGVQIGSYPAVRQMGFNVKFKF